MRETNWVRRERPGDRENKSSNRNAVESSSEETLEEIAKRIPQEWIDAARNGLAMSCVLLEQDRALLVNAILSALRNERHREREACELVALEQRCERDTAWDRACVAIATAIRGRTE